MKPRVVIDTPAWSLSLRRLNKQISDADRSLVFLLRDLIIEDRCVLLGAIRQEILTGISDSHTFESLRAYLREFDNLALEIDDYERAASFSNRCRKNGIANSPVDMLICSIAVAHDFSILTTDGDFELYSRHLPIELHPHE